MSEHLDDFERAQLARAEKIIRKGLKTFVQVGEALLTIRDARLYREDYATFEDYCADRWQISKTHGNRLIQATQVMAALPEGPLPTSERQARELAPLLDDPGAMRRVWAKVMRRTGGKPTAKAVREVVHETIPAPAAPDASAPGTAGAGAPANPLRGESAGDTRSTQATEPPAALPAGQGGTGAQEGEPAAGPARTGPPARRLAGEGGGPAEARPTPGRSASGARDDAAGGPRRPGPPTEPRPEPQPVSPRDAGPESGGTAAPSSSSQVDGADGAPPSPRPVGDGGDADPLLTDEEIHEALTDEWSPTYLEELGCRLALVHLHRGAPLDRAVAAAMRQTRRPGRLPEHAKAVRS